MTSLSGINLRIYSSEVAIYSQCRNRNICEYDNERGFQTLCTDACMLCPKPFQQLSSAGPACAAGFKRPSGVISTNLINQTNVDGVLCQPSFACPHLHTCRVL